MRRASIPDWLARAYDGLDDDVETPPHHRRRRAGRAGAADCARRGFDQFHFYTLNQADLTYAACRLLGIARRRNCHEFRSRNARIAWMKQEAKKRMLLLDGSWGVMIQGYKLERRRFPRRSASAIIASDLKGNNDLLTLTGPTSSARSAANIWKRAPISSRPTPSIPTSRQPGRLRPRTSGRRIERSGRAARARIVRRDIPPPTRPRLVAGVLGPANRTASHLARRERSGLPQHHLR